MEEAVVMGDSQQGQELVSSGVNVNDQLSPSRRSPLIAAIEESHQYIALELLVAGADVHAKDENGRTALHIACSKDMEEVVQALIDRGSRVDEPNARGFTSLMLAGCNTAMCLLRVGASCKGLSNKQMSDLFHHACRVGNVLAVGTLLKNGCVAIVSLAKRKELLHLACREHNVFVAETLLMAGCRVSCLSREEQEDLLRCACCEGNIRVAGAVVHFDSYCGESIGSGCILDVLSEEEQEQFEILFDHKLWEINQLSILEKAWKLMQACYVGDVWTVTALVLGGMTVNIPFNHYVTPLMAASMTGNEEIARILILAGANLEMCNYAGYTALHLAAIFNHTQCGIFLVEAGANVIAKDRYLGLTPLFFANATFREAIWPALSFTTRKTLCIIGNSEGGKSTLIAALQAESTQFLGRIVNRFRKVDDGLKRTAGIETVFHSSQKYGEVRFFDFAGQDDYHGPHQMYLEALLNKPGISITLLLVIKLTDNEEAIFHQLHRWLTPVALMSTAASPPQVVIIGSFLDKVKSKQEATDKLIRCVKATRKDLEGLPLRFVGTCYLNCRQPQSAGIDQLCNFLQDIPFPQFKTIRTGYSLASVLFQMKVSIKAKALQLQEFSMWVKGNLENLPAVMPTPEEVCQDLSATGYALYLPNKEDPLKSWLVLDLSSVLGDVYGTLFSCSEDIANEFGLLHCQHLAELFSHLDVVMIQSLLICLEFCIAVDPSVLNVDLSQLTQSKITSGWLFFPALMSAKPPKLPGSLPEPSVRYLCWQLKTSKKHSISPRILQTILLRLAAHFVVKQRDEEGVQEHCCSIWQNGISWQSTVGVDVTVYMNNRVIHVVAASEMADKLCLYLMNVSSDMLSTVRGISPNLAAAAYIVHPAKLANSPEDISAILAQELFPMEGIRDSITENMEFALSRRNNGNPAIRRSIVDLFGGCMPSLQIVEKFLWTQPVQDQPQSSTEPNQPELCFEGNRPSHMVPLGAQALLDILSTPDMRDVDDLVVTAVAANWQRLALRLGVEGCVSEIVFKNHPNDYEGACLDMLDRWLRGERHTGEEERTWSTLLTALGRAGFVELDSRLRREHFTKE